MAPSTLRLKKISLSNIKNDYNLPKMVETNNQDHGIKNKRMLSQSVIKDHRDMSITYQNESLTESRYRKVLKSNLSNLGRDSQVSIGMKALKRNLHHKYGTSMNPSSH